LKKETHRKIVSQGKVTWNLKNNYNT
jgi:hypothetical protein